MAGKCWSWRSEGSGVSKGPIDIALLGAYVDGELDVDERAQIAEAVARDPEVARQVMVLSRLKSAVSVVPDEETITLPDEPARGRWMYGIAAALLTVMIGASAYWFAISNNPGGNEDVDVASAAHQSWSPTGQGETIDRGVVLAAARANFHHIYVPDLRAAKLQLVHLATRNAQGRPVLVAGYLGSRGCRVTLVAQEDGPGVDGGELDFQQTGGVISARWRIGSTSYAMLAKGMAEPRFRLMATSVFDASIKAAPMSRKIRVALARSRSESKPCAIA